MIGAWEILVETPRMESWIAERPSRILPIRKDLFIDLLEDHLEFAEAYLKRINQQVVDAWDLLGNWSGCDCICCSTCAERGERREHLEHLEHLEHREHMSI